jgi:hypothetical protein
VITDIVIIASAMVVIITFVVVVEVTKDENFVSASFNEICYHPFSLLLLKAILSAVCQGLNYFFIFKLGYLSYWAYSP